MAHFSEFRYAYYTYYAQSRMTEEKEQGILLRNRAEGGWGIEFRGPLLATLRRKCYRRWKKRFSRWTNRRGVCRNFDLVTSFGIPAVSLRWRRDFQIKPSLSLSFRHIISSLSQIWTCSVCFTEIFWGVNFEMSPSESSDAMKTVSVVVVWV